MACEPGACFGCFPARKPCLQIIHLRLQRFRPCLVSLIIVTTNTIPPKTSYVVGTDTCGVTTSFQVMIDDTIHDSLIPETLNPRFVPVCEGLELAQRRDHMTRATRFLTNHLKSNTEASSLFRRTRFSCCCCDVTTISCLI